MPSDKKFIGIILAALAFFWLVFQALTPLFLNAETLGRSLQETVSNAGGNLKFSRASLHAFPSLGLELQDPEVSFYDGAQQLKAEKIRTGLRFPFFWQGRAVPSSVRIEGGQWDGDLSRQFPGSVLSTLQVKNLFLKISNIAPGQAIRFNVRGAVEGAEKSLTGKGTVRIPKFQPEALKHMSGDGQFQIKDMPVKLLEQRVTAQKSWSFQEGIFGVSVKFAKKSADPFVVLSGRSDFKNAVYTSGDLKNFVSPKLDASVEAEMFWDFTSGEWTFRRNLVRLPFGEADINGNFLASEKVFKGLHISLREFSLDGVSLYYPPLKEAIPFNFGFSGPSSMELSLEGKWDRLTLHGDWNMTNMLLTYAPVFSKPAGVPAGLVADLVLEDNRRLSGNFSVGLKETVIKGALPELDLSTGEGEINVISNKFSVAGWENMLLPFQDYKLDGEMKLLANYQGNILQKPGEIKTMLNLTLDKVSALRADGWGPKNITLFLDFAPVSFEVRQFSFELGGSSLSGSAVAYHPLKQPEVRLKLASESLNPSVFLDSVEKFSTSWEGKSKDALAEASRIVSFFMSPQEDIKNFYLEFNWDALTWTMKDLQGKVLGGDLKAKAEYSLLEKKYKYEAQVDRLDLARLAFQKPLEKPAIEGNLFLTFQASGKASEKWQQEMEGEGAFSVTAGAFSRVDLLGSLSAVPELSPLSKYASGQTRFDDLRSSFKIEEGKIMMSKVDLIGPDVSAKADGGISLSDGSFNYRLDSFLSPALSETLMESLGVAAPAEPNKKQLGPVPFLLAGSFGNLQLNSDPSRLGKFQEDLQKKKSYKVFNSFLPEDFLFKRPSNS